MLLSIFSTKMRSKKREAVLHWQFLEKSRPSCLQLVFILLLKIGRYRKKHPVWLINKYLAMNIKLQNRNSGCLLSCYFTVCNCARPPLFGKQPPVQMQSLYNCFVCQGHLDMCTMCHLRRKCCQSHRLLDLLQSGEVAWGKSRQLQQLSPTWQSLLQLLELSSTKHTNTSATTMETSQQAPGIKWRRASSRGSRDS